MDCSNPHQGLANIDSNDSRHSQSQTSEVGHDNSRVGMRKSDSETNLRSSLTRVPSESSMAHSLVTTKKEEARRRARKKKVGILMKKIDTSESDPLVELRRLRRSKELEGGVKFGFVEIYEHPITIGNNPGGFSGPPVTIEWVAQSKIKIPLGAYEDDRPPRRSGSQMNIPRSAREEMLRNAGYSRGEILEALRDVNIARRKRRRTIETMNLSSVHEFRERLVRGSLNLTLNRGRKARERKYLEEAWEVHRQMEKLDVQCDESVDGNEREDEGN